MTIKAYHNLSYPTLVRFCAVASSEDARARLKQEIKERRQQCLSNLAALDIAEKNMDEHYKFMLRVKQIRKKQA